jgi:hypothetical protein
MLMRPPPAHPAVLAAREAGVRFHALMQFPTTAARKCSRPPMLECGTPTSLGRLSVFFLPTAGILEPDSRELPQTRLGR